MGKKIVVIGGGLAGTLICNQMCRFADVTLLEQGAKDDISYPDIKYLNKDFGAVKTLCFGGGGTTNLWHNGLIPLNTDDIGLSSFKDVLEEAKPYRNKAASKLFFTRKRFTDEYENVLTEMNDLAQATGLSSDGVDCLIYPKRYKKLELDDNVKAFYGVENIGFDCDSGRAIETVKFTLSGRNHSIPSDMVVLSAGTLGTPRIVKQLVEDSGNSANHVGVGLADHPMGFVGKIKVKNEHAGLFHKLSALDKGNYIGRSALRIKSECGRYTCCAFFRPALTMANKLALYKYKSRLGASSGMERIKSIFSPKLFHPDILAEIYSHLLGVNIRSRIFNILIIFEQKREGNSVSYRNDEIVVDWGISETELNIYNEMIEKLKGLLLPFSEQLSIEVPISSDWLWSAAHHSGTVAMDRPESVGVIDRNLKMNHFDNVFICDGSVIQEHSYANTGLTIGELSMRLADHLERGFNA